jgi:hypothetical protein
MLFVIIDPEIVTATATVSGNMRSTLRAAHTAAAASTRNTADNTALRQTHLSSDCGSPPVFQ